VLWPGLCLEHWWETCVKGPNSLLLLLLLLPSAAAAAAVLWPGLCLEYWWRTCVTGPKSRDWNNAKMDTSTTATAAAADVRRKESTCSESSQKKLL
jgi:hypothetical protein